MESRQDKLKEILAEAIARSDAAARAAYLDEACAGDGALRAEVEALARTYDEEGEFVEKTLVGSERDAIGERSGTVIGRYRLLQEIGEGGFGVVFMAEQTEPVHRKVALKIVKAGMDTREVIARFEAERQALALMDHPNIARALDAGATESGRPYFVMELVKGIKITDYCDQNDLSTTERLNLFTKVCHAVQHAHQKGIIHRDLKPTNILVTVIDGEPVPKVIDFGVAKALGQRLTEKTLFTAFQQLIGTPAYMSPEQAELSGVDVDTRSDIYSLGVLLYELLTGVAPFDAEAFRRAALDDIRRLIRETEPPKPSTRLQASVAADVRRLKSSTGSQPTEERTRTSRRLLQIRDTIRLLRGDLDWIVMKALEKDRRRRYETAKDLAEDIQRHLEHQPVVASPPSAGYRARKFIRRHRVGVAMGAVVTVALVAGLSLALAGLQRALKAESATRRERDRAQNEAAIAEAVNQFLQQDLLDQASPIEQPDRDVKLRTLVDLAAKKVGARFRDKPLVEAEIRLTLLRVYSSLGEYTNARIHLDRALDIYKRHVPMDDPRLLAARRSEVDLLGREGRNLDCQKLLEELLPIHRRVFGAKDPLTLNLMHSLAGEYGYSGNLSQAQKLIEELLSISRRATDLGSTNVLLDRISLAAMYINMRDYAKAQRLLEDVLPAMRRVFGPEHPKTLRAMDNLAQARSLQGKGAEAQSLAQELLSAQRRILGQEHPDTLRAMHVLGWAYHVQGKHAEAQTLMEEVLAVRRRVLGPNHNSTTVSMECLGWILYEQAKFDEAEELWRACFSIGSRALGATDVGKMDLSAIRSLAQLSGRKGDWEQAVACCQELIAASTDDVWIYRACALAALVSGRTDIYREQCTAMLARFGQTTNGSAAAATACTCLLTPPAPADLAACVRLADLAFASDLPNLRRRLAKGLSEYRQGRWQEVLQTLKGVGPQDNASFASSAHFLVALAHHQLKQPEEAKNALGEANRRLEQVLWCGNLPPSLRQWAESAGVLVLRAQAEQAFYGMEVSPAVTTESLALLREKWNPVRELLLQADAFAQQAQWNESRDAYVRAMDHTRFLWEPAEQQSKFGCLALQMGVVFVKADDAPNYERLCRLLLAPDSESLSPTQAERHAKTCSLNSRALPIDLRQRALGRARFAVVNRDRSDDPHWTSHSGGMAEYRAGEFERAVELLQKAEESPAIGCKGGAMVYRAMALRRLRRDEEARKVIAQAEELLAKPIRERSRAESWDWNLDVCQLALDEARQLFGQPLKK